MPGLGQGVSVKEALELSSEAKGVGVGRKLPELPDGYCYPFSHFTVEETRLGTWKLLA